MQISVIIPTYNYEHLLQDALRTLAAQTAPDFELLIVDDGSTDNTAEVVRSFSRRFRHCRYLRKPHTGVADSRNVGIREATGSHIALLDADDLWSPEYVQAMAEVFENYPEAEMICCNGLNVTQGGEVLNPFFPENLLPVCGRVTEGREFLSFYPFVSVSSTVFTKTAYARIGPFNPRYRFGDDVDWFSRAMTKGLFCVRLDRQLALCRQHGDNLTATSPQDEALENWLEIYGNSFRGRSSDPAVHAYFRKITRRPFLGLLSRYPPERNRFLLRRSAEALGGDPLLEAAHVLTYFGLCALARGAWRVRRAIRQRFGTARRIDMQVPPERIFATLSGSVEKARAMAVGRSG